MSYETATSTILLATKCAACNRPLRDVKSVEIGMGPDCRNRYGLEGMLDEVSRKKANVAIHTAALIASGSFKSTDGRESMAVFADCVSIVRDLGLTTLASIMVERFHLVRIEDAGGKLAVYTPYSETAVHGFRTIPGRTFDRATKANIVPASSKAQLWAVLKTHFAGAAAVGPKGGFVIG